MLYSQFFSYLPIALQTDDIFISTAVVLLSALQPWRITVTWILWHQQWFWYCTGNSKKNKHSCSKSEEEFWSIFPSVWLFKARKGSEETILRKVSKKKNTTQHSRRKLSFPDDRRRNEQVALNMMCTYQTLLLLSVALFYFSNFQASFSKLISAAKLNFVQNISQAK